MHDDDLLRTLILWTGSGLQPGDIWPILAGMAVPAGCSVTWGNVFDLMLDWQHVFELSLARAA